LWSRDKFPATARNKIPALKPIAIPAELSRFRHILRNEFEHIHKKKFKTYKRNSAYSSGVYVWVLSRSTLKRRQEICQFQYY
jgi:hypothetical protein